MATSSYVIEFNPSEFHAQLQQISDFLGEIATSNIELSKAVHQLRQSVEEAAGDAHTMIENVITVLIQLRQNGGHK